MYYYTCQRCGKDFENKNKGKKYCSYDCAKRWKLKESKKCVFCGKQFRRPGNAGKYCSQKCTKEDSKRGMEQPCTQCGKIFYVPDCKDKQHKKNQFCSNKCSRKFQVNRRPVRTCVECGKKFKKKGNSDAKFCGLQCKMYGRYNMLHLANARKKQAGVPSSLEINAYKLMKKIGIKFVKQYVYGGRFVADAFVPSHNTIVQFDGDWWHGNPSKFPVLYQSQIATKERDSRANKIAKKCGYKVVRFWESDFYKKPEVVKNLLTSLI